MKRGVKGMLIGAIVGFLIPLLFLNIRYILIRKNVGIVCSNPGGTDFCHTFLDFLIQNFLPLPFTGGFILWIGLLIGAIIGYFIMKFKNEK
ncbi:MAG: hypothetical protein Q8N99_06125 [Nanoarchaeota archaeon]|nr:hypothetical protein [Nanoarchaeota archaeon]